MDFTKIEGFVLNQLTTKVISVAAINFSVLKNIVKFTNREPQNYDPFNPYKPAEVVLEETTNSYYQRLTNNDRIKDIYIYLLKEINNKINSDSAVGTFPTSLIISLDVNEDFDIAEEYISFLSTAISNENDFYGAFITENKNNLSVIIPHNKISLIVDGQHRMAGMLKLYNDALNNSVKIGRNSLTDEYPSLTNEIILKKLDEFAFGCTLLIGFDLWEQGKVFADVNFNQKPVNKSLYYDIFGSLPSPDRNEIFLSHMLAMHLNNNVDSPLNGFIKMLGRGSGYFSQAFFVEALLTLFRPRNIWGALPMDYYNGGSEHKMLPKFLNAYFNVVKETFSTYWPKDNEVNTRAYKSILVKTTGMGALLRLIQPIYIDLIKKSSIKDLTQKELEAELEKVFKKIKDNGKEYFSSESAFSGAGSLGLQANLFKKIFDDLKAKSKDTLFS